MTTLTKTFVYGTLRPNCRNHWIIYPYVHRYTEGIVEGYRLTDNSSYPYAIPTEGKTIKGTLVWLDPNRLEEAIRDLDALEGTNTENPEGDPLNHYDRKIVTVTTSDGEQEEAYMYVPSALNMEDASKYPTIASGDWMALN